VRLKKKTEIEKKVYGISLSSVVSFWCSYGIVLWEIVTRSEPFQEYENFEEFRTAVCYHHKVRSM
jgi:hypothetical protein